MRQSERRGSARRLLLGLLVTSIVAGGCGGVSSPAVPASSRSTAPPSKSSSQPLPYRYMTDTADGAVTARYGYNLVDVGTDKATLDALPAGQQALVWLGGYDTSTCSFVTSDQAVTGELILLGGDPKVAGYYLADEADDALPASGGQCPNVAAQVTSRSQLVHKLAPGAFTYEVVTEPTNFAAFAFATDILGTDPYPCLVGKLCDTSMIPRYVQALHAAHITRFWGVLQAFSSGSWRYPTAPELQMMIGQWQASGWQGEQTFAWKYAGQSLSGHPDLLSVLSTLNRGPITSTSGPSTSPPTTPPRGSGAPVTKVLVIMDENHGADQVFPNGMPYLYGLAQRYGEASAWSDVGHPSLPNYLAIFSGSSFNNPQDCNPGPNCTYPGPSVFGQALAAGKTARSYEESMPRPCLTDNSGNYDVNHNPWAYVPNESQLCQANDLPQGTTANGALASDIRGGILPNVGLVTPNLINDAHNGTLADADAFLRTWMPLLMSGPDWTAGRLAIVVTFDEGEGSDVVPFVVIAPNLNHVVVTAPLNHYALTRFIDQVAGVPLLRSAEAVPDIASLFGLAG